MDKYTTTYINDLVKRSGKARATVYRKLKSGWTDAEIVANSRDAAPSDLENREPTPQISSEADSPLDSKFAVTWAQAVMWAADNLDESKKQMTRQRAGSAIRYNLFLLGKDDPRELHVALVPKALNILDKHANPEGGDIIATEEKNVAELEELLARAIAESQC